MSLTCGMRNHFSDSFIKFSHKNYNKLRKWIQKDKKSIFTFSRKFLLELTKDTLKTFFNQLSEGRPKNISQARHWYENAIGHFIKIFSIV